MLPEGSPPGPAAHAKDTEAQSTTREQSSVSPQHMVDRVYWKPCHSSPVNFGKKCSFNFMAGRGFRDGCYPPPRFTDEASQMQIDVGNSTFQRL